MQAPCTPYAPALFGLILAGGASTRMQRDKAALSYHGRPQLRVGVRPGVARCAQRRSSRCARISATNRHAHDFRRSSIDSRAWARSPASQRRCSTHPKAAWLVVACDLPFLTESTLRHLIDQRDPDRIATAYRSSMMVCPSLCARSGSRGAREPLLTYLASGKQCPRKFLIRSDALAARPARTPGHSIT